MPDLVESGGVSPSLRKGVVFDFDAAKYEEASHIVSTGTHINVGFLSLCT